MPAFNGPKRFLRRTTKSIKALNKKRALTYLSDSIPWEAFRSLIDKGYSQDKKSNNGCKRIGHLILL